jgi:hypothetical protein
MSKGFIKLGQVSVHTTQNKGHDPEFWAQTITKKICDISDHAPDHVRQQALAFQNHIYTIILNGMKSAIESDRVTIRGILSNQGHEDMAKIIKELK